MSTPVRQSRASAKFRGDLRWFGGGITLGSVVLRQNEGDDAMQFEDAYDTAIRQVVEDSIR